jgi:hypothetical protein
VLIEKIISQQIVDVRHRGYEEPEGGGAAANKFPIPIERDPSYLSHPSDYLPPAFPAPSVEFTETDWLHCGQYQISIAKAAYSALKRNINTQNAIELAGLAFTNFNLHLAGQWYQVAAIHGKSDIAMAELSGIFLCVLNEPNKEAAYYWYIKSNRVMSGMLVKGARPYALDMAGKKIQRLEVKRQFTDPTDRETFKFFCRPVGKSIWMQFHPRDFEREGGWTSPRRVGSPPSGGDIFECEAIADIYFNMDNYNSEERLQRSNNLQ